MDLNLGQRECLLEMLNYKYSLPVEYHESVKKAIKKHATNKNYSDNTIDKMVRQEQSIATSISSIREGNLTLFRGKFAEWLMCMEYNSLKNKGNVIMTIVNPDPTSKADLLHIIKIGNRIETIQGPDVKSGGSTYVFNQWKKIVTSRYEIPMIDIDGILTTEEGLKKLTSGQKNELEKMNNSYPNKKPIKPVLNNQDLSRVMVDYLKFLSDDITPAGFSDKKFISSKENRERLKKKINETSEKDFPTATWLEFKEKSRRYLKVQENYKSRMTLNTKKQNNKTSTDKKEVNQEITENKNKMEKISDFFGYDNPIEMAIDSMIKVGSTIYDSIRNNQTNMKSDSSEDKFKKSTHSSPKEHSVKPHKQKYHTKEGTITKNKNSYKRGKNKN